MSDAQIPTMSAKQKQQERCFQDEFALWLNLKDVYWAREGRASIDAVILFGDCWRLEVGEIRY